MKLIQLNAKSAYEDIHLADLPIEEETNSDASSDTQIVEEEQKEPEKPEISPNVVIDGVVFIYHSILRIYQQKLTIFGKHNISKAENEYKNLIQKDLLNRIIGFLEKEIKIAFVFDVSKFSLMDDLSCIQEVGVTFKRSQMIKTIPQELYMDIKDILNRFGAECFEVENNIHYECTKIAEDYQSLGIVTEDLAFLAFGASAIIRYINPDKGLIRYIHSKEIIESFDIDQRQFADLCILLGCDYSETFELLNTSKIFHYIKKYKDIDSILDHFQAESEETKDLKLLKYISNYDYGTARSIINPEVTEKSQSDNQEPIISHFKEPNLEETYDLLTCGKDDTKLKYFAPQCALYTKLILERLNKDNLKLVQTKLDCLKLT
ncbi:unnamed protein product [Moneuplotes crassus]|uniref:XPG-I domain-containing protein n=1 Tax=Euplotes crassus TaxID=5936 RepID=A0AAD1US42_EUPCR|nr:unnamed protein product [Moneuplotes crassus]